MRMSRPRTRSQGPPETEIIDGSEESQHIITQGRLSRELQVRLETLRFYPAWGSEGKEALVSSQQQTATTVRKLASIILRPPSTIPSASRPNSALGIQTLREVSTKFSQHHVVPMHNSMAEDGKQDHTISLAIPHTEDIDIMDIEFAEIVEAVTPTMDTSDQSTDRNNTMMTKNPGITGEQYNFTALPSNTFITVNIEDKWLKRYIPDGKNSQICDMVEKVEVITKDGTEWYKVKIRFYNTDMFLVGKRNDCIYAVRGEETELLCMQILWIPYNLNQLEELLKEDHYLRWKGIMRFEEEGENLMDRLVSREERAIPKDMNFRTALTYENRQKLYEKRLKLTKALPIIQHEMSELESENESNISLYITQKSKFMASLRMLIDQIDSILRRDDSQRQTAGLPVLKIPIYYPSGVDLWAEMPIKIIKKAAEEHEECMMSIDDARSRQQIKHIGIRKTSKGTNNIPSMTSAFQRVHPSMSEGHEASPVVKEREHQEAIKMASEV